MQITLLLSSLGASVALAASLQRRQPSVLGDSPATYTFGTPGVNTTYDYVVVGGGTAGLALATRLAANSSLSVAVIEAGGFYEKSGNTSTVPAYDIFFSGTNPNDTNPDVDWGFVTEPQAVCDEPDSLSTKWLTRIDRARMDAKCTTVGAKHWEDHLQEITCSTTGKSSTHPCPTAANSHAKANDRIHVEMG